MFKKLDKMLERFDKLNQLVSDSEVISRISEWTEYTKELAEIIQTVIRKTPNYIDPATRTFQALRIAVNNELGELENGLTNASTRLKSGGCMVVVSFHSLEDRIVKTFFKENTGQKVHVSRYKPVEKNNDGKIFAECSKAIEATPEEININKRSRSAKLRYAIRN